MEPKPQYTQPEWNALEELDLNPQQAPEAKPKGRFFYKLALITLVLIFLAGIVLPNLSWIKTRNQPEGTGKQVWAGATIPKAMGSTVFYAPNGASLIILDPARNNLDVYKPDNGSYLFSLTSSPNLMADLSYTPDGKFFAIALDSGDISILDSLTGNETKTLRYTAKPLRIAWSPLTDALAAVYDNGELRLWDLYTDTSTRLANSATGKPNWSPNGRFLSLAPDEPEYHAEKTRLFDTETMRELHFPEEMHDKTPDFLFLKQSNQILYNLNPGGQIIEWNLDNNTSFAFDRSQGWLGPTSVSPDERMFFAPGNGGDAIHVWDLENKAFLYPIPYNHFQNVGYNCSWSPDSKYIVVSYENIIDLHLAETGKLEKRFTLDPRYQHVFRGFSPDSEMILRMDSQNLSFWSVRNNSLIGQIPGVSFGNTLHWLQNGSLLLIETQNTIDIYKISTHPVGPGLHISAIHGTALAFETPFLLAPTRAFW